MLVIDEGKCADVLLWLRCRHTPPSTTRCSLPFVELRKLRISTVPPSAMRNVVTMPFFFGSLEKFWKLIQDPSPVTSTRFVVGSGSSYVL